MTKEPIPNEVMINESDYFKNGEFVDRYYSVHIPIINGNLAKDIGKQAFDRFASTVDFEFSDDDGGHICFYYSSNYENYKNLGISIAEYVRQRRDERTDNSEIYKKEMGGLRDYVNKNEGENTENAEENTSEDNEDLRYIH